MKTYTQKKQMNGNLIKTSLLLALFLFFLIGHSNTYASIYFLGVGNDGYHVDTDGLWTRLASQPGWDDAYSRRLTNRTGTQIVNDIAWLQQADPGDLAIFFYSGHGGASYDDNSDESNGFAIDSYDETIGYSSRYVRDDAITNALSLINPEVRIITILDTCYAGGFVGGSRDLNRLGNVTALLSCQEDQYSHGFLPNYSLFTNGLINGLATGLPADFNRDGILNTNEWFNYAVSHMPTGYDQDPYHWESRDFGNMTVLTPEPATVVLLGLGSLILRRKYKV